MKGIETYFYTFKRDFRNDYLSYKLLPFSFHNINTGWPRKNATLLITNFKEIRDLIILVSAVMSRSFFFQQNYTKINDFDEGVLILEPFF